MTEPAQMLGPYPLDSIITGDARLLAREIPDESVDLVVTDPPYPKQYLYLFEWLAIETSRILKQNGLLITLTGHDCFDKVFNYLNAHLNFYWVGGMKHTEGHIGRVHTKQMLCSWKPVLWFAKNGYRKHPYVFDLFRGKGWDKQFHKWGQDAAWYSYYLSKLTIETDIILDPFCGGGTVPAVCKMLGRHYLAFEISESIAEIARKRVRDTQPPLFTLQSEQRSFL